MEYGDKILGFLIRVGAGHLFKEQVISLTQLIFSEIIVGCELSNFIKPFRSSIGLVGYLVNFLQKLDINKILKFRVS